MRDRLNLLLARYADPRYLKWLLFLLMLLILLLSLGAPSAYACVPGWGTGGCGGG